MVRGEAGGALRTGPKERSTRSFRAHLPCVCDNSNDGNDVDVYDGSDGGATAVLQYECVVIMVSNERVVQEGVGVGDEKRGEGEKRLGQGGNEEQRRIYTNVNFRQEKRSRERDIKRERRKKTNNRGGKTNREKEKLKLEGRKRRNTCASYTCATVAGKIKGYGEDTLYMYSFVFAGILLETSIQAGH